MANTFTKVVSKIVYSLQEMGNLSFDDDFQQNTTEQLVYDPIGSTLKRHNTHASNHFKPNNKDAASSTVTYFGFESASGTWMILKIDKTSNPVSYQYATQLNNNGTTTYATAWSTRASLTYNNYSVAY